MSAPTSLPPERFIPRDLNWLSFNQRVLLEAKDSSLPLYDRLKFLAIFSSNLDEFFRVRVSGIRALVGTGARKQDLQFSPQELLTQIYDSVQAQQEEFGRIFWEELVPGLAAEGIELCTDPARLEPAQRAHLDSYFHDYVRPQVQPILLAKGKVRPFLREGALYLTLRLGPLAEGDPSPAHPYAMVNLRTETLGRFVECPCLDGHSHQILFLDDVLRYYLPQLFPGYSIQACHAVKLNRGADLPIEDEYEGNLVEKIRESLVKRKTGPPARFLYDHQMDAAFLAYLQESLELRSSDLVPGGRYHNFDDFFRFPNPLAPRLESEPLPKLPAPAMDERPIFKAIAERDRSLHLPYQAYHPFINLLNEAASDPAVRAIKMTQYRVAAHSRIVSALINAANNGKAVTVFVEVKARFDEAANLYWAEEMQRAGVDIIYSMPGLKVHAKLALVKREEAGQERRYAFLSTGNFNEKTARLYADHGIFTAEPTLTGEVDRLFEYLAGREPEPRFEHLLVAQFNLRERFLALIDREIAAAKRGEPAWMIVKVNNLEEKTMIAKLYEAAEAGVEIDLIVRSICCLVPEPHPNLRVRRIVGRFLEHARVFVFHNGGQREMYLASADWMTRNLHKRIESGFPVQDPAIEEEIMAILDLQLRDNTKAVWLDAQLTNHFVKPPPGEAPVRAQLDTYELVKAWVEREQTKLSILSS